MRTNLFITLILAAATLLISTGSSAAKHLHHEKWYQEAWCGTAGGETEHRLSNRTRVDCLTETRAIEFDFGKKWAESIGQALHYGGKTVRQSGVVLIIEKEKDVRYWNRLVDTITENGLDIDACAIDVNGNYLYAMSDDDIGTGWCAHPAQNIDVADPRQKSSCAACHTDNPKLLTKPQSLPAPI